VRGAWIIAVRTLRRLDLAGENADTLGARCFLISEPKFEAQC
jgi:hypothetical protein